MASAFAIVIFVSLGLTYASSFSEAMERGEGLSRSEADIWSVTLEKFAEAYSGNSLVGAGYRGFWESDVGVSVWRQLGTNPLIQSHNGYLEMYLNGGLVGLFLLAALLAAFGWSAAEQTRPRTPTWPR